MALNGVMALILRYFTEFGIASGANCVKVVEDVVVKKFTFAISSPEEFLVNNAFTVLGPTMQTFWVDNATQTTEWLVVGLMSHDVLHLRSAFSFFDRPVVLFYGTVVPYVCLSLTLVATCEFGLQCVLWPNGRMDQDVTW